MKLRIEHGAFADAVRWGTRNVAVRPTVPALAGALLSADDGTLTISCFDYETSSRVSVEATVSESGTVLVPGRLLAEIAKTLPELPVDLALDHARVRIVCGGVRFALPTMPVEDYPALPTFPETIGTVDATAFARAVTQTAIAASRDDTLPVMTGIEVEANGGELALAATDRFRMAVCDLAWSPAGDDVHAKALVPARILAGLAKSLGTAGGDVTVGAMREGDGSVTLIGFASGTRSTVCRVLDGRLPQLRALIGLDYPTELRVDTAELMRAARRVSLVASRDTAIRLNADGDVLTVEAGSVEGNADASEALACGYEGEAVRLAFKPGYLLDCLAAIAAPTTRFAVDGDGQRILIAGEGDDDDGYRHMLRTLRPVG